jgi:hypothetical protein
LFVAGKKLNMNDKRRAKLFRLTRSTEVGNSYPRLVSAFLEIALTCLGGYFAMLVGASRCDASLMMGNREKVEAGACSEVAKLE